MGVRTTDCHHMAFITNKVTELSSFVTGCSASRLS